MPHLLERKMKSRKGKESLRSATSTSKSRQTPKKRKLCFGPDSKRLECWAYGWRATVTRQSEYKEQAKTGQR